MPTTVKMSPQVSKYFKLKMIGVYKNIFYLARINPFKKGFKSPLSPLHFSYELPDY
jgi:hypothetical protein